MLTTFDPLARLAIGLVLFYVSIKLWGGALKALDPEWIAPVNNPYAMFALALAATALVQSSSVTTSALVVIAATGQLSLPAAIGGILGANVGTTVTAWLAAAFTGMSPEARQIAAAHSILNLGMAAVVLPLHEQIAGLVRRWF